MRRVPTSGCETEVGMQERESVRETQNLESIMTDGRGQQRQMMHTTGGRVGSF